MKLFTMRRAALLTAGIGAVGLVGAFTFTGTSALYTSQVGAQDNVITSGTIQLDLNSASSVQLNLPAYMPGDSATSRYDLSYSGTGDAFVALDFSVVSTASKPCTSATITANSSNLSPAALDCSGRGELPLLDGSAGSADLFVEPNVNSTAHQLIDNSVIQAGLTCATDAANVVSCSFDKTKVLLPKTWNGGASNAYGLRWPGQSTPSVGGLYVKTALPATASDSSQGSTTHVIVEAYAVQWKNNQTTQGAGCAAGTNFPDNISAADAPCPISWS